MACVDVTPVFDLAATAALIASFGGGDAHGGVGPVHAEVGTGAQVTISVWRYDLACDTDLVSATASSDITYGAPASWDLTQDGVSLLVGSSVSPPAIWGALTPATGHERLPAGSGILASGYDSFPLVPTLTGTWSGGTLPVLSLYVGVVADVSWTVDPAASVDVTPPTLCLEYTVGSPCATPVPIPQNDTATTTTGTTINIDAMNNDDNTACAPGCVRVREAATFIDPSSTATGITASVDITGAVSFSASGAGTAILNLESGCSPTCDPLGADVATWVPQTLTVTVTPAVTPGPCVEIVPVFNPAKTAALAAMLGMEQGTASEVNATAGVGTEWAVGVYTAAIPVGCENDIAKVVASSAVNASAGVNALNDGALLAVTDDYSTLTPWGTVAPTAGTESVLQPGFLWTGFGGQGGPTPIGNLLEGAWSAGPLPKTEFDLVVITDARGADTPDGEYVIAEAPKVCVTYAEGSPCAPTPRPCVEVPVTFSQADTDTFAATYMMDASTDPAGPSATAGQGTGNTIWVGLVEIPEGCDADVVDVTVASTVNVGAGMVDAVEGAGIVVASDPTAHLGWGTVAATDGDVSIIAPEMISTGYTGSGGAAWPTLPATIPLAGVYSGGTLPASTLAVVCYVDASGDSAPGSTISMVAPSSVCVTFSSENCPPATDPIPVDDTATTTTGTTITVDAAANDNNAPCDPLPGCAVYREGVPFIDPGSTATGITVSVDAAGEVTFTASGPGVAVLNVESGCSPTCDPNGADVTTWVSQTVTITVTEPVVPCPTQLVKNCLAETPIVGCAEYAGVPAATVLHSVTGINGDVIPVGSTGFPAANGVGSDGTGFIRSYYTNLTGAVVTPDAGTFTAGDCATAAPSTVFTAGGASIASGTHAATLGPDGTSWSAPTGLRSLTVAARRANITDATGGAANRVDVVLNTGTFRLLEGETFTWSVDDPDSFNAGSVNCIGDAAAAVVWVTL